MKAKGVYSYLELTPPLSLSTDAAKALKAFSKECLSSDVAIFFKTLASLPDVGVGLPFTQAIHFCTVLHDLESGMAFSEEAIDVSGPLSGFRLVGLFKRLLWLPTFGLTHL